MKMQKKQQLMLYGNIKCLFTPKKRQQFQFLNKRSSLPYRTKS